MSHSTERKLLRLVRSKTWANMSVKQASAAAAKIMAPAQPDKEINALLERFYGNGKPEEFIGGLGI